MAVAAAGANMCSAKLGGAPDGLQAPDRLRAVSLQAMHARRLAALILSASAIAGCGSKTTLLHTSSSSSASSSSSQSPASTTGSVTTTTAPAGTVKSADGRFATVIPDGFANELSRVQGGAINIQYLAVGPAHD